MCVVCSRKVQNNGKEGDKGRSVGAISYSYSDANGSRYFYGIYRPLSPSFPRVLIAGEDTRPTDANGGPKANKRDD